ncbi:hypothetical protein HZA97_01070 [Candidatus Woesearchaeota archaeon]|nr:hypothetical protein [Candidatus Woesearchaeota archaeon]
MSNLEQRVDEIINREIIEGKFSGNHKVEQITKKPRFEAHIDLKTSDMFIGYNPEYIDDQGQEKFEEVMTDIPRHEINHECYDENGIDGFTGCPRNADLHLDCFMQPMSVVLGPKGFTIEDIHYVTNLLQDTILHADLNRKFALNGINNFFEEVGQSRKNEKFTSCYDAHAKLNLFLWGNKKQKKQLKKYFTSDETVKEVLNNFLKRTGIKDMTLEVKDKTLEDKKYRTQSFDGKTVYDHKKIREYLTNENNWKTISTIYAEEFSKLMTPGYAMPLQDNSGKGTEGYDGEKGQEQQSKGNQSDQNKGDQKGKGDRGKSEGDESGSGESGEDSEGKGKGQGSQGEESDDGSGQGSGQGESGDEIDDSGSEGGGSGDEDGDDSGNSSGNNSNNPSQSPSSSPSVGYGIGEPGKLNQGQVPSEGHKFDKEIYNPNYQKRRVRRAYRNNEQLPPLFNKYESLDLLYQMLAGELKVNAESFSEQNKMPVAHYGKRPFNPERDKLKHIKFGFSEKGELELQKKKYHVDINVNYKKSPKGFPQARFGLIDSSGSMASGIDNLGEGKKSIIPWGDNSCYHYALLSWYGFLEYLKKNQLLKQMSVSLGNFSDRTYVGKGLTQAKRTALSPQWGGTALDLDKVKEFFKYRDMIIFTISDGGLSNWAQIKDEFIKDAKKHYYFHLQIGAKSNMAQDLEKAGLKVVQVSNAKDLASTVIDLTDKLYRGR